MAAKKHVTKYRARIKSHAELVQTLHDAWSRNRERKPSTRLVKEQHGDSEVVIYAAQWRVPIAASCSLTLDGIRIIE